MDDLICGAFFIIGALAAVVIYRRSYHQGYWDRENDPIFLDARNDESQIIEAGSVAEQRRSGRERGGSITLTIDQEPLDYSAQLNLRSVEKSNEVTVIREGKSDGQQR